MLRTRSFRLAALAAASLLAACSSDTSVGPSEQLPTELTTALGEMSLPTIPPSVGMGAAPMVSMLGALDPSGCNFDATSGGYTCPTVKAGGMTISRGFTLLDASGGAQRSYDRSSTAAIRTVLSAVGSLASGATVLNVDQRQTMTLSGLLTGVHTLNGTSVSKLDGTTIGGPAIAQSIASTQTLTVTDVVLSNGAAAASPYPRSGVLDMVGSTSAGGLPALSSRLVLTFNGTSRVPVSITVAGVTRSCTLDLAGQTGLVCLN